MFGLDFFKFSGPLWAEKEIVFVENSKNKKGIAWIISFGQDLIDHKLLVKSLKLSTKCPRNGPFERCRPCGRALVYFVWAWGDILTIFLREINFYTTTVLISNFAYHPTVNITHRILQEIVNCCVCMNFVQGYLVSILGLNRKKNWVLRSSKLDKIISTQWAKTRGEKG